MCMRALCYRFDESRDCRYDQTVHDVNEDMRVCLCVFKYIYIYTYMYAIYIYIYIYAHSLQSNFRCVCLVNGNGLRRKCTYEACRNST
jgi:hypothetical protein